MPTQCLTKTKRKLNNTKDMANRRFYAFPVGEARGRLPISVFLGPLSDNRINEFRVEEKGKRWQFAAKRKNEYCIMGEEVHRRKTTRSVSYR